MTPRSDDGTSYRECRFTSQDGLSLYFRDYGDPQSVRTPVLCLAGLTRNSKDFNRVAARLAAERRVLCPDYRGRGRSAYDPDWRNYVPATYFNDIRHLLAATGVHRVIVVGTSMGGLLACGMAVAMPTAVAAAVINDIGPVINGEGLGKIVAYLRDSTPLPDWDTVIARLRVSFPNLPVYKDGDWFTIAEATYRKGDDGRLYPDWDPALIKPLLADATYGYDLWGLFRALGRMPVLMIRGAKSDVLTAETFARMGAALPHARCLTLPGVGHAPNLSEPQAKEAIDALLREL
jgi:pimeloyl-ACP methyl ester carboxylesterase